MAHEAPRLSTHCRPVAFSAIQRDHAYPLKRAARRQRYGEHILDQLTGDAPKEEPPQAAGIADHVWSVEELVQLAAEPEAKKRGPYKPRQPKSDIPNRDTTRSIRSIVSIAKMSSTLIARGCFRNGVRAGLLVSTPVDVLSDCGHSSGSADSGLTRVAGFLDVMFGA